MVSNNKFVYIFFVGGIFLTDDRSCDLGAPGGEIVKLFIGVDFSQCIFDSVNRDVV